MRIKVSKSKNSKSYSIIKDVNRNGKRTTCIHESLGTLENIRSRAGDTDPFVWMKSYVQKLNEEEKLNNAPVIIKKDPSKLIQMNVQTSFNVGYLFLQDIYYNLGLDKICKNISKDYQFKFDLNEILSKLIYSRILYPSSKLKTLELSKNFLEQPEFKYQHIERSLPVICENMYSIQADLYKNSKEYIKRNNKILYYDCTNYYFETEMAQGLRQYGKSKENRPNPIVQMGLFMDGNGIPLAFDITAGNTNEQITLKPLEEKIIKDFKCAQFVVCTDAGLASLANRKLNDSKNRSFITTQSIKKLKSHLKDEALDLTKGWKLSASNKEYDISALRYDTELMEKYKDRIFFKERWINENGLEQRLIVTFSVKYQNYQRQIRSNQIDRAIKIINSNPKKFKIKNQNDPRRFINLINITNDGEVATKRKLSLNQSVIDEETKYDGLYAVCTNLEDDVESIIEVNKRRWEIEESFRIMKNDFKSRPVYHSKDEMIKAHFLTCFISLIIYRCLEKILDNKYTTTEILSTLRNMNMVQEKDGSLSPNYIRTDLTDDLHRKFDFRTDFETISNRNIKKIIKQTKKKNSTHF